MPLLHPKMATETSGPGVRNFFFALSLGAHFMKGYFLIESLCDPTPKPFY